MALWENVIGYGTHADRPAAGAPGALYFEYDTGDLLRDSGTVWQQFGSSGLAFISTATDLTLTRSNINVVVTATGVTITLPPVAANAGKQVNIAAADPGTMTVTAATTSGDTFYGGGTTTPAGGQVFWCDGALWYPVGI